MDHSGAVSFSTIFELHPEARGKTLDFQPPDAPTPAHLHAPFNRAEAQGGNPSAVGAVLLVEDEDYMAELTNLLLQKLGFRVRVALSADAALAIFAAESAPFIFVMTDLRLGDEDGLALTRQILALQPATPVILCTGLDTLEVRAEARRAGARLVAQKPVSVRELKELLIAAGIIQET